MTARRLAAILAADVVGFSKLLGEDDAGTLVALKVIRKGIVNPVLAPYGGRIFKLMDDGLLAEFPSAVQALEAAETTAEVAGAEIVLGIPYFSNGLASGAPNHSTGPRMAVAAMRPGRLKVRMSLGPLPAGPGQKEFGAAAAEFGGLLSRS